MGEGVDRQWHRADQGRAAPQQPAGRPRHPRDRSRRRPAHLRLRPTPRPPARLGGQGRAHLVRRAHRFASVHERIEPITIIYHGVVRKHRPDSYLPHRQRHARAGNEGQDSDQDHSKRHFLAKWVLSAATASRAARAATSRATPATSETSCCGVLPPQVVDHRSDSCPWMRNAWLILTGGAKTNVVHTTWRRDCPLARLFPAWTAQNLYRGTRRAAE